MANRVYGYQGYNKGYQFETSPKSYNQNMNQMKKIIQQKKKKQKLKLK